MGSIHFGSLCNERENERSITPQTGRNKMVQTALNNAKQVMFLSIALFFLVATGWTVRLYWLQEPVQAIGRHLLAKDGALLVSILSNPRTIKAVRAITAPPAKATPKKSAAHYLIDQLVAKNGNVLRTLSQDILKQPTITQAIQRALRPKPSQQRPPIGESLGRYALDRLFEKNAKATNLLLATTLRTILQQNAKRMAAGKQQAPPFDPNKLLATIGTHAIDRLFQPKGKLILQLSKQTLAQLPQLTKTKANAQTNTRPFDPQALLQTLGKRAIDRLTDGRAQPIRAILQDILGPEPERTMRSVRQITAQVKRQLSQLHLTQLVREAAFQLGKGGLEAFLVAQQQQQLKRAEIQQKIAQVALQIPRKIRQTHTCFVPKGRHWLQLKQHKLIGTWHYLTNQTHNANCHPTRCVQHQQALHQALRNTLQTIPSLRAYANTLQLTLLPTCAPIPTKQIHTKQKQTKQKQTQPTPRKRPSPTRKRPTQ
jgi:hypothetical protein